MHNIPGTVGSDAHAAARAGTICPFVGTVPGSG